MERIPQPIMDKRGEPHMKRFEDQRWVLDNIVRSNGIDWDQPRSIYISGPCGMEGQADIAGVRERVKKMADIAPAFEAVAVRREAKAKAADEAGNKITARDNYFMAAVYWGAAQWPYDQNDEANVACHLKKRENYTKYAAHGRPQGRGGVDSVQGHGAAGLVPPAAELQRRQAAGDHQRARHGQLQGNPDRALRRPLSQPRLRRAQHRRAGPVRVADARHLFLDGQLGRDRQGGVRLARQAARSRHEQGRAVGHELRHLLRHALQPRTSRASRPAP